MEITEDQKVVVGVLYIGAKIAHKGTHNLIQVGSSTFDGTTTCRDNWSASVARFMDLVHQVELGGVGAIKPLADHGSLLSLIISVVVVLTTF